MIPKFSFSLSLLAFLLPFFLITCNDKKTKELKPLVMQDQLVYTVQGYKILTNTVDKKNESLYKNRPSDTEMNADSFFMHKDSKKNIWPRISVTLAFLCILSGLISQFFLPNLRRRLSVVLACTGIAFLLIFYGMIEYTQHRAAKSIEKMNTTETKTGDYLSGIEYSMGLGSGFYICILGLLLVLYYYLFFIKKYQIIKNTGVTHLISAEMDEDMINDPMNNLSGYLNKSPDKSDM